MAIHTVAQGETLLRIAKHYGLASAAALYDHPSNERFRAQRPNPDLIYPGDKIIIPDPNETPAKLGVTNRNSVFVKSSSAEYLRMRLQGCQGARAELDVNGQSLESTVADSGLLEFELPENAGTSATLQLYLTGEAQQPTHTFRLRLAYLDPVETLSGIQARCNNLGYDCGVVDGVMGSKTRDGVKQFQASFGLAQDGDPGPQTQKKLQEAYGS
ncbi:PGRP and LysM peptidoglycan-binding domain-containing protein [Saccharospirillum salsuginis]|uniref:LysM domain-containing protein n=1 Tax=Saccharospirillum salsuginis TaxID=418750 RepID=A0A918K0C2_9GAMM|nr:peptidoglycan-binding protein [Saccharospirillum salsuginis]GGX39235.1 hypothetical protein GCM10007392_01970 [Saccharospirillum salsuginis]